MTNSKINQGMYKMGLKCYTVLKSKEMLKE